MAASRTFVTTTLARPRATSALAAALLAWLSLLALLGAACSRSALGSPAHRERDSPSGTGQPSGGAAPNAPRDAGPPWRDPPGRDAGPAPTPTPDAATRPATDGDAGSALLDAGAPDAEVPELPPEPPPLRAPGHLVFTKLDRARSSLWAMRLSDFTLRQLDPPAALRPVAGVPVSYSPDGRKLLIVESDADETRYRIVYRCREPACAGRAQPSRVVLRGPADDPDSATYRASPHAPDSSALLLQTRRGAFYVRLPPEGPEDAVQLSVAPYELAHFVGGARGLLLAHETTPGVTFVDLAAEPLTARRLLANDGTEASFLRSLSPDGQHWLTDYPTHRFSLSDVLAGNLTGAQVTSYGYAGHAGDQWFVLRDENGRMSVRSWDGSKQRELANDPAHDHAGCDNRVLLVESGAQVQSLLDLSASASGEPPAPLALTAVPLGSPRFVARCSKAVVRDASRRVRLVDLADGSTLEHELFEYFAFNERGTLMGASRGVYTTTRVDTLANATPLSFSPRRSLDASPLVFAHDGLFFVAAGPLLDMMQQRLYRVDFSDASQAAPEVEVLSDRPTEANNLVLTRDDRYLAYGVRLPRLAVDPATVGEGVYERDLTTGATEQIAAPFERALNGRLRVQPIPGQQAVLVMGNYPNAARESLYLANLDSGEFVRQIPDEAAPRVALDGWSSDDYVVSRDGALVWYRAVGAKPSRFAQRLRFSSAEPLAPAQLLEFEPELHAYAYEQMDSTYTELSDEIGPLFRIDSGAPFNTGNEYATLHRFDLQSGTARVLARADGMAGRVGPGAFAARRGLLALQRWEGDHGRISFVRAGALEHEEAVFSGIDVGETRFSPDERWFAFSAGRSTGEGAIHLRDLETGDEHVLPHSIDGVLVDVVHFDPASPRVLALSEQKKLYAIELAAGDAKPVLVAEGMAYFSQISRDGRVAVWSSSAGTFVSRLDGSLQPRRIASGDNPFVVLSPSGRRVLVREHDRTTGWRLIRTDLPEADPVPLAQAVQHNIEFDPSERYAVAHYDDTGGVYMAVWALDDPSTPHRVLAAGETGWSFWVEGPAL